MIEIKNIYRNWGDFSLKNLNLTIQNGEYFVLLGPTGAGKTLVLELMAGFYQPEKGYISFNGNSVGTLSPEKRNIGFVYQNYSLFPHMDVGKNIGFGARMRGIKNPKIRDMAEYLDISHILHRNPETLSGGEQQRVALARALIINPDILLLDEPLSALDPRTQEDTRKILKKVHEDTGVTVVHVTHDQTEARVLADRIGVMMDGGLVQVGTPGEIFNKPANNKVADFVGVENVFNGIVTQSNKGMINLDVNGNNICAISDYEKDETVYGCLRPENVTISKTEFESSARNTFYATVLEMELMGVLLRVKLNMGNDFNINSLITRQSATELDLKPGDRVVVSFKAAAIHII
ncbi:ABC transporter ATP-binding protein [Methanohalobium sp.]|uniref:ABC transporter ATP-binding protein n=1 Tax=Methanohalobium sp. TaxID=2837493 RepID=UPI0025FD33F5|nr:ABC transporter ATP-binding protein [Methanohalobium sp.]